KSLTKPAFSKLIYQPVFRDRSGISTTGYLALGDFSADKNITLLVGNRLGHINPASPRGSVEIYLRSPSTGIYSYRTRFEDPQAADFSSFGSTIVFSGNSNAIIGNPTQPGPNGAYNGGRISLFRRDNSLNTYSYETGINGANGAMLGHAMSMVGDSLLVSLPGANSCRLYTLTSNAFNLRFTFNRPAGDNGTYGDAVAMGDGGNVLAISSTQSSLAGRVYIIRRSGAFMNPSGTLTAPNEEPDFGKALLFTNSEIVVGGGNRVYVYNSNIGLNLKQTLQPDHPATNSDFGAALAYHEADDALYVGAPLDNSAGGGMVYKYSKNADGNFELTERIYDFGGTEVGSRIITDSGGTLLSRALRCGSTTIASF
ncbi:MAG: hypothetical protein MUE99_11210, partial [Chitinophagaceae bacterium]|nr:hypothetical protein [Chitinophagaceae bacterium]